MLTLDEVMAELERKGSEQTRRIYARHGIRPPMFGVSVAHLKTIAKTIRGEQEMALALYDTGNYDARYLAGLVADGSAMTRRQLEAWAKAANCEAVATYVVPWVLAESEFAAPLARKWIGSKQPLLAICGWTTFGGLVAVTADEDLDLGEIRSLLDRVGRDIDGAPDRVRYAMNQFVIAVGSYVKPLLAAAKRTAARLGTITVDMGDTACKVPVASAYIAKVEAMGRVGKKRKTMRC